MTPDHLMGALGGISALVAVAAGAFGAHSLSTRLSSDLLSIFERASAISCTMRWR